MSSIGPGAGLAGQGSNLGFELCWQPQIIGIEERNELPARCADAEIAKPCDVADPMLADNHDARVAKRFDACDRIVGRTVVDDDQFPIGESLIDNRPVDSVISSRRLKVGMTIETSGAANFLPRAFTSICPHRS